MNILLLDGATGTALTNRGMKAGDCPEQFCIEHPEVIQEIQSTYVKAGSNIIYAPTFGANRVKLSHFGLGDKVSEINKTLVRLSKEVAENALVAGDLAPVGLFIAPFGESSMAELIELYKEQAAALEEAGVDLFVFETTMTIAESRAAFIAIREVSNKPIMVTFTSDENGRTLSGADIRSALIIFQSLGAEYFGLNCSGGPFEMLENVKKLSEYAKIPLVAKPNAGLPKLIDGQNVYDMTPENFKSLTEEFISYGVRVFGGCCGTTEEHIQALRSAVSGKGNLPVSVCEKEYFASEKEFVEVRFDLEYDIYKINSQEDLTTFEEEQFMLDCPLVISAKDDGLLEDAIRVYNGRLGVKCQSGGQKEITEKYGAIVL